MLHSESKIILTVSLDGDKYKSGVHFKKKSDREKMVISRIGLKNIKGFWFMANSIWIDTVKWLSNKSSIFLSY